MMASVLWLAAMASLLGVVPISLSATSAGLFAMIYPEPANVAEYRRKDRRAMVAWMTWVAIVAAAMACEAVGL